MGTTHVESLGFNKTAAAMQISNPTDAPYPVILIGSGSPNGVYTAPKGSIYLRYDTAGIYQNTDGATAWTLSSAGALPQGLDVTDSPTFIGLTLSGALHTPTSLVMAGPISGVTTLAASGDVAAGTMHLATQLVSKGAADSGGTGFALLRVPN